jgi:hypothetical protein
MKNLEEIRIKTILQDKFSVLGLLQTNKERKDIIAKIADVHYSEKDDPKSAIMRIIVGDRRYYCHKNASMQDFELLKAVLTPSIKKIDCFK